MQILAEWPRVESVTPTDYPALATFCCGTIESWERDVNRTFELLNRGEGLRNIVVRVAEHRTEASLLGAGGYLSTPLAPFGLGPAYSESVYIPALGVSEAYRGGWRVPDGSRIGECILEDLLTEIRGTWEGQMPRVWAVVDSKNEPCQRLLGNCGFSIVKAERGPMDMWLRRPGLDPEWRRDE